MCAHTNCHTDHEMYIYACVTKHKYVVGIILFAYHHNLALQIPNLCYKSTAVVYYLLECYVNISRIYNAELMLTNPPKKYN
jgi:hypothetical protein